MTKKIPTQAPRTHLANNANNTWAASSGLRGPWESREAESILRKEGDARRIHQVLAVCGALLLKSSSAAAFLSQYHYLFRQVSSSSMEILIT